MLCENLGFCAVAGLLRPWVENVACLGLLDACLALFGEGVHWKAWLGTRFSFEFSILLGT